MRAASHAFRDVPIYNTYSGERHFPSMVIAAKFITPQASIIQSCYYQPLLNSANLAIDVSDAFLEDSAVIFAGKRVRTEM